MWITLTTRWIAQRKSYKHKFIGERLSGESNKLISYLGSIRIAKYMPVVHIFQLRRTTEIEQQQQQQKQNNSNNNNDKIELKEKKKLRSKCIDLHQNACKKAQDL